MRTIRLAEHYDLLCLLQMAERYAEEAKDAWDWFDLDGGLLCQNIMAAIDDIDHVIFVAEVDGELAGAIWGAAVPQVMTRAVVARDLFHYVYPERRDYWTAKALVEHFEHWANKVGCKAVSVGAHSGVKDNRGARFVYQRMGYKSLGEDFIKKMGD